MHGVAKSAGSCATTSRIAWGPPVDAPITISRAGVAIAASTPPRAVVARPFGESDAGRGAAVVVDAAVFTLVTISRRRTDGATGAPGVYLRTKSTAPSSSARSV